MRYRKDGTPLNVIAAGSPIMVDGVLKGVVAVYTDITDRVQAEKALSDSQKRFLTVLDSIDATIYVADMQTHEILFMNRNMIESFGRDMTGEICWGSIPGGDGALSKLHQSSVGGRPRPADRCYIMEGEKPHQPPVVHEL